MANMITTKAVYMFYALAIVCDVYFVPSLEKICENLHLSEDVAGATFMAAGSSAPELFTSLIGVFITKGDVGVGTIVGSAVFNILVIIGVCGIFAGQTISLTWWPLFRDSVYYIISILALILIIYDEKVLWWETLVLISMYGIYILIMKFNGQIWGWVELKCGIPGQPCLVSSLRQDVAPEEASTHCDTSMILMKKGGCFERVKWFLSWPLSCLLYSTVPNCLLPHWERWFMVTFVVSTLWIAVFSYLMVWMVTIISFTLDIPDVIMGITFLAAGTSVPDCMASLIVARQGMGDMAVSNSIGSNIFDILLGLGFPWALRTLVVEYGSTVLSVHLNRWRLDRRLGLGLMVLYGIFLLCSICFETLGRHSESSLSTYPYLLHPEHLHPLASYPH
ncbi:hypothetical protein QTP70_004667 [Hemibagrus guttatus]|uniref:Sodium/calcium exchanger membrane region domain-containing protein n=1 Tax=Hemibagrus guttatus TaxID=175788 RepID=A0AAE0V3J6_9TELE|nr:hypothetical protein QTP70_004667 [Hemibagrus guttatus]